MTRREYFSFPEKTEQFDAAFQCLIQNLVRKARAKLLSPENEMRYSHGRKWVSVSSDASDEEGEMKRHSTIVEISMQNVREHNLAALPSHIMKIVNKIHAEMKKMMYQTVSDSCEKSGNTINAKDYETSADAFLAMLNTVEFGVDRDGQISRPEMHLSAQAFANLKRDAEAKGQSFQEEVDKIIKEKSDAALEREKQRLARFKT